MWISPVHRGVDKMWKAHFWLYTPENVDNTGLFENTSTELHTLSTELSTSYPQNVDNFDIVVNNQVDCVKFSV